MRKILSTQHVNFLFVFSLSPGRDFFLWMETKELNFAWFINICDVSRVHINTPGRIIYEVLVMKAADIVKGYWHSHSEANGTVHKWRPVWGEKGLSQL